MGVHSHVLTTVKSTGQVVPGVCVCVSTTPCSSLTGVCNTVTAEGRCAELQRLCCPHLVLNGQMGGNAS